MVNLKLYEPIAQGIVQLLHPFAEVVIHDIRENRIVSIHNGFSKRKPGDDSMILDREGIERGPDVFGPFRKAESRRSSIKYVSIKIKDDDGRGVGLMCVNLDLSAFSDLQRSVSALLAPLENSGPLDVLFDDDWQGRITLFVKEALQRKNRTLTGLTREERTQLVGELQDAGAFRSTNAHQFVANTLGVSRATVYNDLSAVEDSE